MRDSGRARADFQDDFPSGARTLLFDPSLVRFAESSAEGVEFVAPFTGERELIGVYFVKFRKDFGTVLVRPEPIASRLHLLAPMLLHLRGVLDAGLDVSQVTTFPLWLVSGAAEDFMAVWQGGDQCGEAAHFESSFQALVISAAGGVRIAVINAQQDEILLHGFAEFRQDQERGFELLGELKLRMRKENEQEFIPEPSFFDGILSTATPVVQLGMPRLSGLDSRQVISGVCRFRRSTGRNSGDHAIG